MKLSKDDRRLLKKWGYKDSEIDFIEVASSCTIYSSRKKNICDMDALNILGREEFLSGLSRSAFHYSATRRSETGIEVSFDNTYFNYVGKYGNPAEFTV